MLPKSSAVLLGLVVGFALTFDAPVVAQTTSSDRTIELWTCTLNEGKTQEDVQAANSKWIRLMNAEVDGGDIHSYVLTSVVGDPLTFLYIDSFCQHGELGCSQEGPRNRRRTGDRRRTHRGS